MIELRLVGTLITAASAIVMAIPVVRPRRIELPVEPIENNVSTYDANRGEVASAISGFNRNLWEAFQEQRRYTLAGLFLLTLGVLVQLAG